MRRGIEESNPGIVHTIRALPGVLRIAGCCFVSIIIAVAFTEVHSISDSIQTGAVPAKHWGIAFVTAGIIFGISEARKWLMIASPKGFPARIAW